MVGPSEKRNMKSMGMVLNTGKIMTQCIVFKTIKVKIFWQPILHSGAKVWTIDGEIWKGASMDFSRSGGVGIVSLSATIQ